MPTPYIVQSGRNFSRKNEVSFVTAQARVAITSSMVSATLVAQLPYTMPFDGVVDEQGTFWQLKDRDVVYGANNVKINLYSIYEIRNMINTQSTITVGGSAYSRFPDMDSTRGYAWRNNNTVVYTKNQVGSAGITYYTDTQLVSSGGTATASTNPSVTSAYTGGWQVAFSVMPNQIAYTVVSSGTYGS